MTMTELEAIAQSHADVRVAVSIGADRVELCQGLALGGLTPSIGTLEHALEAADGELEVHPLIRVRGGNFAYSADEIRVMALDIAAFVAAGAHGVVIGALDASGRFDEEQMRRLIDAAGEAQVSLHRAVDVCADTLAAVEWAASAGIARILTSGRAPKAADGKEMLAEMARIAGDRLTIMAGGGIRSSNVAEVLSTRVGAVHFSASSIVSDTSGVSMGSADSSGVGSYEVLDREQAAEIAKIVRAYDNAQPPHE